jgi:signal transduction histidine kinase
VKIRTRFLLLTLPLALLVFIPTGLLAWKFLSIALEEQLYLALDAEAAMLQGLLAGQAEPAGTGVLAESGVNRLATSMDRRISVYSADGTLLFDSDRGAVPPARASAAEPEVARAMRTGRGTARRADVEGGAEFLFVAKRISSAATGPVRGAVLRVGMSAAGLHEEETSLRNMLVAIGSLLLVMVGGFTIPFSGWMTRKLVDMEHTARLIARGSLSERATVESGGELEKLNNQIETLQKLERVRSEFLGNVSHELRTPIFAIQGFMETLLDGAIDDPAVNREFLEKAYRQADRLNALLRDLIEISRIESGEMKMSFRYFPVWPFLRQIVDEMNADATRKSIALTLAGEEGMDVYADRDRLRQVMVNLIDNAIKYTDPGGSVTVTCRGAGAGCELAVSDTGCGIAGEHVPRIFERFYRADRDRSREVGGTGLGLAIVKHIVEAHEGEVRVQSAVGKGSTFSFTLKR